MTITVPLKIIDLHEDGYHPLIEVTIYGKPSTLVLDTGASKTAFDHAMLLMAGDEALIKSSDKLSTGLGTNSMTSSTALISGMHIGDFIVPDFEVAVLDLSSINIAYRQLNHPEVLGVLGGDILMKYKAMIDYGNSVLRFEI
ncbi:MAG: retropepsin-like aspartic protease [Mucilaginibacter sp.]